MIQKCKWVFLSLCLIGVLWLGYFVFWQFFPLSTAYYAKILCSGHFVSGRTAQHIFDTDLSFFGMRKIMGIQIGAQSVSVSAGFSQARALYRPGLGCTLVHDDRRLPPAPAALQKKIQARALPRRIKPQLQALLQRALEDRSLHTRALVIAHKGLIVAEAYGDKAHMRMPLPGWSMSKSVLHALIGALVAEGHLQLKARAPVPEWQSLQDPRRNISLDQLLRQSSGLAFSERYSPLSDATRMLFLEPSAAAYAAQQQLIAKPGTQWEYNSGNSNILGRIFGDHARSIGAHPAVLARQKLFAPLGMRSAVIEVDAEGDILASSFVYATARDWIRFGLLYAQDKKTGLLPEGWISYAATPTPHSNGSYGAHWWLNSGEKRSPLIPSEAFYASGYEGQFLWIIASESLVVLRMGYTPKKSRWDNNSFIGSVLAIIRQP